MQANRIDSTGKSVMGRGQRSVHGFPEEKPKVFLLTNTKYTTLFRNFKFFSILVDHTNFAFINLLVCLGVF